MDLILWRHAEAEDGTPDNDRKLTALGRKQAKAVAGWLQPRLPKGAIVYASPAVRTQQTARALTRKFETCDELKPASTVAALLKAAGWPGGDRTVVIVGHQPTLGRAAAKLLFGSPATTSIKKGALWWFSERDGKGILLEAVIAPDQLKDKAGTFKRRSG